MKFMYWTSGKAAYPDGNRSDFAGLYYLSKPLILPWFYDIMPKLEGAVKANPEMGGPDRVVINNWKFVGVKMKVNLTTVAFWVTVIALFCLLVALNY